MRKFLYFFLKKNYDTEEEERPKVLEESSEMARHLRCTDRVFRTSKKIKGCTSKTVNQAEVFPSRGGS